MRLRHTAARRGEPGAKLLDRVGMKIGTVEPVRIVFVAQPAQFGDRRFIHIAIPTLRTAKRLQLVDADDRADRQIDKEFFRRVSRQPDTAVRSRVRLDDTFMHAEIPAA